jgi:hypothetical protein
LIELDFHCQLNLSLQPVPQHFRPTLRQLHPNAPHLLRDILFFDHQYRCLRGL